MYYLPYLYFSTSLKDFRCIKRTITILSRMKYSSSSSLNVFDRRAKKLHRDWSASLQNGNIYDYLKEEVGDRVADRVYDVTRKFPVAVELGCGRGHIAKHLTSENIGLLYQCDMSRKMLDVTEISKEFPTYKMVVDEEFLPFAHNSIDIVLSSLCFHWINDLPSTFKQIMDILKPDGVLIASMLGGETLFELRSSLQLAEMEREGGFSPHISPFARVRDIGDLLTQAGYAMLTIDTDEIKVNYPSMFELLEDLRGMSENNAALNRRIRIKMDSLIAAASIYQERYGNEDRTVPATFEIIYLIGWKPHKSQAKPAKRGSGKISMKDISKFDKN